MERRQDSEAIQSPKDIPLASFGSMQPLQSRDLDPGSSDQVVNLSVLPRRIPMTIIKSYFLGNCCKFQMTLQGQFWPGEA